MLCRFVLNGRYKKLVRAWRAKGGGGIGSAGQHGLFIGRGRRRRAMIASARRPRTVGGITVSRVKEDMRAVRGPKKFCQ
jgi:hypothetical protein